MNKVSNHPTGPLCKGSVSRPFIAPKPPAKVASVTSVLQKAKEKKALPALPRAIPSPVEPAPRLLQRRGSSETVASTASYGTIRRVNLREKYGSDWEPGQPPPASYLAKQAQAASSARPATVISNPAKSIVAVDPDILRMSIGNAQAGPNDQRGIVVPTPGRPRRPSISLSFSTSLKGARDRLLSSASTRTAPRHAETDKPKRSFYDSSRSTASSATLFVRQTEVKPKWDAETVSIGPGFVSTSRKAEWKKRVESLGRTGSLGSPAWIHRTPKTLPPRPATKAEALRIGLSKKVHYLPPDKVAKVAGSRLGHRKASSSSSSVTTITPGRAPTVRIIDRDSKQKFDPETIHQGFPPKDTKICNKPLPAYEFPTPAPRPPKEGYKVVTLEEGRLAAEAYYAARQARLQGKPVDSAKGVSGAPTTQQKSETNRSATSALGASGHLSPPLTPRTPVLTVQVTEKRQQRHESVPVDVSDCDDSAILSDSESTLTYRLSVQDDDNFLSDSKAAALEADMHPPQPFASTTPKPLSARSIRFADTNSPKLPLTSAHMSKWSVDSSRTAEKASIQASGKEFPNARKP